MQYYFLLILLSLSLIPSPEIDPPAGRIAIVVDGNSPDPRIQQIWLQGKIAEVDDVVTFQKGKWDYSDAGMILYWITGATDGGLTEGTVEDVREMLLAYIERNPKE